MPSHRASSARWRALLRVIKIEIAKLLRRRLGVGDRLWGAATPKRNTVLDKIIEFAKVSAVLNFYVRATLQLRHPECPPDTDVLKISSLPKRGTL